MLWQAVAFVASCISAMSSIRNRLLGRIWNSSDTENTSPTDTRKPPRHQSLTLSNDSGYASGSSLRSRSTNVSLSQQATTRSSEKGSEHEPQGAYARASTSTSHYSTSRRSLHKAASTTFKFFSDTIRSKTQLFYVESERPGTPYPLDSAKPTKQDHKSRILSSLRSRHSRKDRAENELENPVTRTIVNPDIPHELHVDIPGSTLLEVDSPLPKEAQYAKIVNSCTCETRDSFLPAARPRLLLATSHTSGKDHTASATAELVDSIDKPGSSELSPTQNTTSPSEFGSAVPDDPSAHGISSDGGEAYDTVSPIDNQASSSPQAAKSSRGFRTGGNLFVKGNREQTRKTNTPSPYRRALRSSESLDVVMEHPANCLNQAEDVDVSEEVKAPMRPAIKRATSLPRGLSDIMMTDHEGTGSTEGPVTQVLDGYDGDAESSNELVEEPSMGPRSPWDKARADRQRRYQVVRTMSAETERDTSDEEGLELRPYKGDSMSPVCSPTSPMRMNRKVRFVTAEEDQNSTDPVGAECAQDSQPISSSKEVEVAPYGGKIAAEATEQNDGDDIWHLANESLTTVAEPRSVDTGPQVHSFSAAGIRYAMEAIDRRDGSSMNSSDEAVESESDSSTSVDPQKRSLRWSSEENFEKFINSPLRPMNTRQLSTCSISTADSCAVTTSSPLCFREIPSPSLHLHTTPVRRTSSINDGIHQVRDETESHESFLITPPIEAQRSAAVWSMQLHPPTPMKEETTADGSKVTESGTDLMPDPTSELLFSGNCKPSASCSSSMCAPSSDFVEGSEELALIDPFPRTESDLRPFNPQLHSSMPNTWNSEQDPSSMEVFSDSGDDMSLWLAEHPDSESLPEAGFGQGALDNELDFLAANPELGQYLEQSFSTEPHSVMSPTLSDGEDEWFRTPLSSPLKRGQRAKRDAASTRARALSSDSDLHKTVPSSQHRELEEDFIAARLPSFKTKRSHNSVSSQTETLPSPFTSAEPLTSEEVLLLRDITPTDPGATRSHGAKRSWRMRDTSYGGENFVYEAMGSPKKELQTSSVKKGVWWGRNQESAQDEEDSPLAGKQNELNSGKECGSDDEPLMRIDQHIQRDQQDIDDVKALLSTSRIWSEPSKSPSRAPNEALTPTNKLIPHTPLSVSALDDTEPSSSERLLSPHDSQPQVSSPPLPVSAPRLSRI